MSKLGPILQNFFTPALVLILAGVVAYDHLTPRQPSAPASTVDGKSLGRAFATSVAVAFGDSWIAAADTLEGGKSIGDAQAVLQAKWQEGRTKAFTTLVAPEFSKVLGEGVEPADPAQRAAVVRLWRDFAAGLKGGR